MQKRRSLAKCRWAMRARMKRLCNIATTTASSRASMAKFRSRIVGLAFVPTRPKKAWGVTNRARTTTTSLANASEVITSKRTLRAFARRQTTENAFGRCKRATKSARRGAPMGVAITFPPIMGNSARRRRIPINVKAIGYRIVISGIRRGRIARRIRKITFAPCRAKTHKRCSDRSTRRKSSSGLAPCRARSLAKRASHA